MTPHIGPQLRPGGTAVPLPFDLCGPLPTGVTLLEASAGTGKTYAISALATRFVAEGVPLEQLLVITFTRMATGELRERVRERLVRSSDGVNRFLAGAGTDSTDELLEFLCRGEREEVMGRADRLSVATADFDAATIDTTHGFCLQVLSGLGVTGDVDREVNLVEDVRDLLGEVVDDLYVRRFWRSSERPTITRAQALEIGRKVLANPGARILPEPSEERTTAAMRRRLAQAILVEIDRRKRVAGILTYDDLLSRLRETLADEHRGPAACRRLRDRYRVALVDEFQDTDPVQWEIMGRAFGQGGSTLILVGDPKQAIYAFRGADVYAYLEAAANAAAESTLGVNWRSDQGLIAGFDALFENSQLGHPGIVYRVVEAAPPNAAPRLRGAPHAEALRFRLLDHSKLKESALTDKRRLPKAPEARAVIARDLAADVAALFASGAQLAEPSRDGTEPGAVPLAPGDVAVLVRANSHARTVRDALHEAGIPAVIAGSGSVFATDPATEWLRLLEALERPTNRDRAATLALTSFVGWEAEQLAVASDDAWELLHEKLHRWSRLLDRRGVAALFEAVNVGEGLPGRVLSRQSGERFLTDLRHVGQLLHSAAVGGGLGPTALLAWLRRRIAEAELDLDDLDRSLRLESDAQAVQVLTIHRSKGLEFPVVYCPFLWDGWRPESKIPVFHDPDHDNERTVFVGGYERELHQYQEIEAAEERGESLRLLYVALTRACHQAVVWWAGTSNSGDSPLGRLLFARDPDGQIATGGTRSAPSLERVRERLLQVKAAAPASIALEMVDTAARARWEHPTVATPELSVSEFTRQLDQAWRRSSFSAITARSHVPFVASEPELERGLEESVTGPVELDGAEDTAAAGSLRGGSVLDRRLPLALSAMPGGMEVGTIVHRLFESLDFTTDDLAGAVRSGLEAELDRSPLDLGDLDSVVAGICAAIEAPLGPLAGGARLRDLDKSDRLDEMSFELPLVGGERSTAELSTSDLAEVLRSHLPPADPLHRYAERLGDPTLERELRGYLTGSLDLVLRVDGRFLVADYKTNRLAGDDEPITAWHYRPEALEAEMQRSHYPLQALLYTVALHRYLRWRLAGYEPSQHLAGVLYLFLRGMSGPPAAAGDGAPCGVWAWKPSPGAIEAVSDLFDRGARR